MVSTHLISTQLITTQVSGATSNIFTAVQISQT